MDLNPIAQKILIYIAETVPSDSDVSLEELELSFKDFEGVEKELNLLKSSGVLKEGINPNKDPRFSQESMEPGERRFYLEEKEYNFLQKTLPEEWKKRGIS